MPQITLIITGPIRYDAGDGQPPTLHDQMKIVREWDKNFRIWCRIVPPAPTNWEFFGELRTDVYPLSVVCHILDSSDFITITYVGTTSRIEAQGIVDTDFATAIDSNDASHVGQRVIEAFEAYLTRQESENQAAQAVQQLRDEMALELKRHGEEFSRQRKALIDAWDEKIQAEWKKVKGVAKAE